MAAIIIESIFRHCDGLKKHEGRYGAFLKKFEIVSTNQECRTIQYQNIEECYERYLNHYQPDFRSSFFEGKTVLIAVASGEEAENDYSGLDAEIIFFTESRVENIFRNTCMLSSKLKTITLFDDVESVLKTADEIARKKIAVQEKLAQELFEEASREFKKLADLFHVLGLDGTARDCYAYAAIAAERTEKWRKISYLWYCAYEPIKDGRDYNDYNSLEHTYPSISFEKWSSYSESEKRGRALQYAAYSDDNHDGPSDSYWIYEAAAQEYMKAGNYQRTIECAVSATNRYALCFHSVKAELIKLWEDLLRDPRASEHGELLYVSCCDIYRNLNLYKAEEADFFYVETKKLQQKQFLEKKEYGRFLLSKLWSMLTKYGTTISRIVILSIFLVLVLFPMGYFGCQYFQAGNCMPTTQEAIFLFLNCVKMSLDVFFSINVTLETSGIFYLLMLAETFYAYIVLVIISSSIISRSLGQSI